MPPFVVCRPFVAGIDMCFSRFASKMMVSLFQLFADVLHCALPWDSLQTAVGSVCCGAESAGTFSAQPEMDTRRISEEVSPAAFLIMDSPSRSILSAAKPYSFPGFPCWQGLLVFFYIAGHLAVCHIPVGGAHHNHLMIEEKVVHGVHRVQGATTTCSHYGGSDFMGKQAGVHITHHRGPLQQRLHIGRDVGGVDRGASKMPSASFILSKISRN